MGNDCPPILSSRRNDEPEHDGEMRALVATIPQKGGGGGGGDPSVSPFLSFSVSILPICRISFASIHGKSCKLKQVYEDIASEHIFVRSLDNEKRLIDDDCDRYCFFARDRERVIAARIPLRIYVSVHVQWIAQSNANTSNVKR